MNPIYCDPQKRHDFVLLFDATDGNPNGDPDASNQPRVDPETMQGLVTDVALKRKIRDWVQMMYSGKEGYNIYIQSRDIGLNDIHKKAHEAIFPNEKIQDENAKPENKEDAAQDEGTKKDKKPKTINESDHQRQNARRNWLCQQFYDIRTFGAVMSTGDYPSGQVRGPVQLTFARSIDQVFPLDISITRIAVAKIDADKKTTTTMGRKALIPYGLYRGSGFFVPAFAQKTGVTTGDLEVFWEALRHMWETDRSASRGTLAPRGIYIFTHDNPRGNAFAHHLFEMIQVQKKKDILVPRHFSDYTVTIDENALPEGITLTKFL